MTTEYCYRPNSIVTFCFLFFTIGLCLAAMTDAKPKSRVEAFRKCVGEQIEVARQNWDTVIPTSKDSAEFVAQDQLRDFITEVCYGSRKH